MKFVRRFRWSLSWQSELERRVRQLQAENRALLEDKRYLKYWLARTLENTMPDFPTAEWRPSRHFIAGHGGLRPLFVIVHVSDTTDTPSQVADAHDQMDESVHYIVGRDGSLIQCVSEVHSSDGTIFLGDRSERFWSIIQMGYNPHLISFVIEVLKDPDQELSNASMVTSFVLIKDILERHRIPMQPACETGGVTGHFSLDGSRYPACGKSFPYSSLLDYCTGVLQALPQVDSVPNSLDDSQEQQVAEEPVAPKRTRRVKVEDNE